MSYNGVKHLKTASGNAPEASMLDHGAIAIAYKEGEESIFIKNTNDEIVKISSTKVFKDIDTLYARISEVTGGASDALQSFKEVNDWIKEHEEDYKELTALTNTYATQTSVNSVQTTANNAYSLADDANDAANAAQASANSLSVLVNDSEKGNNALYDAIQGLSVGTESNAYSCLLIELIANNAQTTANSAQTSADNAQTSADNAQTAANNINTKLNDTTSGLTALYNSILSLETYKNELFDEINAIKIQLGGGSY